MQKSAQKRALITGATSGIGKEMAIYLHSLGWQLTLTGRNEEALQRMAALFGEGTKYIALDLAKRGAAERLYTFCRGDRIDLLINNAGFGVFGTFTETSLSEELELIGQHPLPAYPHQALFARFRAPGQRLHPQCRLVCRLYDRSHALELLCLEKLCGPAHTCHP